MSLSTKSTWLSTVSSACAELSTAAVLWSSWKQSHPWIATKINPTERNLLALLQKLNALLPQYLNTDLLTTSYTALPIKVTLPFLMKHFSSLHCLMFLSRSTSLFIILLPPHTETNRDITIWFAGSLIYFNIQITIVFKVIPLDFLQVALAGINLFLLFKLCIYPVPLQPIQQF